MMTVANLSKNLIGGVKVSLTPIS